ncbi:hypothetical protein [Brachybacterium sacelli]|uniref:Uncharacterized protein n=1 Tax=Brachybacterium sacelli TaxID=173364 RepID=A0ABS4X788_9MICO|nr:hypothetical protein [Brachybacterium sacelli]MBP2384243.1 hypothetical protein [Brachybacterium sacelli]
MSIEEIQALCGGRVSVWDGDELVAEGLLGGVDVVSAPEPPTDGEGWRVEQSLVLEVDGEAHRVRFEVKVVPQT